MRNRLFPAALIGVLCAASGCITQEPAAIAIDRDGASQNSAPSSLVGIFGLRASSQNSIRAEHYQVPSDFDNHVALHPYTSVLGPCPQGGPGKLACSEMIPPSHYNR
jgi:hypothetical protein